MVQTLYSSGVQNSGALTGTEFVDIDNGGAVVVRATTAQIAALATPPAQFSTAALAAGTLAAGLITGSEFTVLQNTGATPGNQTTRTAAQMFADFPFARAGLSYVLRVVNTGAGTMTLVGGTGVTVSGTATIATNTFRDYVVTFVSPTAVTIQSVGSGVSP